VHSATAKPYACPVCGWRFHLIHNMKRHLTTHEESGDIEVGTADELLAAVEATATRPSPLTSPRAAATSVGSNAAAAVPASVDGMVSPASMASSEDSTGQLKCNICNKWFTDPVGLTRHMEVHSADRPFACPICGWRFKQVQNMKRHMLSHSGAKPYSCDFCEKSYTDNYSLKQHVAKVHPGVASTIPNMMTNSNRTKKSGPNAREESEEGFKSMVNEMTTSQKTAAVHLYQQQLASTGTEGGDEAFVIDDSGPGDLEDEGELDPSKYMENMSGEMEEDEMEEVIMEDEEEEVEEVEDSIEMSGLPEISDVVSMAE